jgi:hypothetical protein
VARFIIFLEIQCGRARSYGAGPLGTIGINELRDQLYPSV